MCIWFSVRPCADIDLQTLLSKGARGAFWRLANQAPGTLNA